MKRRTVVLNEVPTVVLDEADRMLDMGFIHDVTADSGQDPHRKNLGMFSATISREVMDISWVYQRDPEEITVQATQENKPDILQYRLDVDSDDRWTPLPPSSAQQLDRVICFCNTKGLHGAADQVFADAGLDAQCIHGDIPQKQAGGGHGPVPGRELHVFVATDVASRGIDVDDVDAVFNFEVPEENEYYIHRIGRTGAGQAPRRGLYPAVGFPPAGCGWTISPATPAARSSPPSWRRTARWFRWRSKRVGL